MPVFVVYILKLSVSLAVIYLFYRLILQRLTFYNANRWYLLAYTVIAFFIPFVDISDILEQQNLSGNAAIQWVPLINDASVTEITQTGTTNFFTIWNLISLFLLIGMMIMLVRLLIQFVSFRRMLKKAAFISGTEMKIYHVDENIIPFSFGNSIFINRDLHSEAELEEIIRHEFVHVKQVHSIDIIWGEFLCLLNWYNPFAWLLKKSIRQNLEFIADHKVLENGIAKKEYQYLLLKVMGNNQYSIANQFNFSSLKKRIAMMNKLKTTKVHLVKFLLMLPVLGIILVSFRKQMMDQENNNNGTAGYSTVLQDTVPAKHQLPDNVKRIRVKQDKVTVTLKNGSQEEYDLGSESQKAEFEKKYGELPPPPPPPPAPAPPAPPSAPPPPPPAPPKLPDNVQRIQVNKENVTVWLKDGAKERYDLSNSAQKKNFEKKYGKLPPPPPPVPPVPPIPAIAPVPPIPAIAPVEPIGAGYNSRLNDVAKEFEITDTKAVIKLNDGTIERYDLTDKNARKQFETKYGKLYTSGSAKGTAATPVAYVSGSGKTVITPMAPRAGEEPLMVDDYGYAITGKEDVLVTITKNTTRSQLDDFVKQMKAKGIDLYFENVNYNDGILTEITGYMKSKDGRSNFVATDFSKLILAMIKKGERTYFKVSVKDDKVSI
ncbi:MAG: M56 family metallopeptidase [Ferruginibacter sp.]